MLHLSISLRALVFVLILAVTVFTGSDVAQSAPSADDLVVSGDIVFTDAGQEAARDIHTGSNTGGLRFYNGTALTNPPQGAAIQFFDNDRNVFNGQAYIDSGAHNNAAIIFRTAPTGFPLDERLRIDAGGNVKAGAVTSSFCVSGGNICAAADLIADGRVLVGSAVGIGTGIPLRRLVVGTDAFGPGTNDVFGIGIDYGDVSPNAGFIRFGDNTGWKLHLGRSRESAAANINTGTTGVLLTLEDNGRLGLGRQPAANTLEVEGTASKATSGDWLSNSDARIKRDVGSIDNALAVLSRLHPARFRYAEEYLAAHPAIADREYLGYIAQEYQDVFPDYVQDSGEDNILQVDSYAAEVYAVRAIQELHELAYEQQTKIAALEEQNATLEARLAAIEQRLNGVTTAPLVAAR